MLDVDVEKERISLGIKQLAGDPFADAGEIKKGQVVTCEVIEVKDSGIEVKIVDTDLQSFIRRAELARDRQDQRPERFAAGERIDARVTMFDRKARRVTLSIKALEMAEEKEAMAQFGSADSRRLARRHPRRGPQEGDRSREGISRHPGRAMSSIRDRLQARASNGAGLFVCRRSRCACRPTRPCQKNLPSAVRIRAASPSLLLKAT